VTVTETAVAFAPLPALLAEVLEAYPVVVPYSKYQLVAWPFGVTLPASFAAVVVMADTEPVTAEGAPAVVKVRSPPRLVPASLVATSR
jgi:hypothetical protein